MVLSASTSHDALFANDGRLLEFSHGNAKLPNSTMIFSLPSGHTCPGALECHAWVDPTTGRITDGPHARFRCYSATAELRPAVRNRRWRNLARLRGLSTEELTQLLTLSVRHQRLRLTERVRWFEGGDCYSAALRDALIATAHAIDDLTFYLYSKSLHLWAPDRRPVPLPENLFLTASWGGRHDDLIAAGLFPRNARVLLNQAEADLLGMPVDFTDALAYDPQAQAFAHLVHATQPSGSAAAAALSERRRTGAFTGYSAKPLLHITTVIDS